MKKILITISVFLSLVTFSQTNADMFEKIAAQMKDFKTDTTQVPDDALSKKIEELRSLRGGFNINEAIEYKILEERKKENAKKEELDKMSAFFKTGNGKKRLNNAVTWIYRRQFSYDEIEQLIQFYKTSAGKKMAESFPVIMIQSFKAAEEIGETYKKQISK